MILQKTPNPNKQPCPDFMAVPVQTGGLFEVWGNPATNQVETFARIPLINGRFPKSMEISVPTTHHATGWIDRLYKTPKFAELGEAMKSAKVTTGMQMLDINNEDISHALSLFQLNPPRTKKHQKTAVVLFGITMLFVALLFVLRRS